MTGNYSLFVGLCPLVAARCADTVTVYFVLEQECVATQHSRGDG